MASQEMQFDEDILEELRCPVCLDYMHPPIRTCHTGHSFCDKCDKNLETCPYCRGRKSYTRNYALENIHNKLAVPCKNRSDGCSFVSKGECIVQHEDICIYSQPEPSDLSLELFSSDEEQEVDELDDDFTVDDEEMLEETDGNESNDENMFDLYSEDSIDDLIDTNSDSEENESECDSDDGTSLTRPSQLLSYFIMNLFS